MQTGSLRHFFIIFLLMIGCYLFQLESSLTARSIKSGNGYLSISVAVRYGKGSSASFKGESH